MNKITHQTNQSLKVGQLYTRIDDSLGEETYIVSKVSGKFVLISLNDGENWTFAAEKITDVFGTTEQSKEFTLVTRPFTINPET